MHARLTLLRVRAIAESLNGSKSRSEWILAVATRLVDRINDLFRDSLVRDGFARLDMKNNENLPLLARLKALSTTSVHGALLRIRPQ